MLTADEIRWTPDVQAARESLALSDDDLLVATLAESDAYRLLAQLAIQAMHEQHAELRRLREARQRLVVEYRALRERTMREAA
jgi:hypothetical protein